METGGAIVASALPAEVLRVWNGFIALPERDDELAFMVAAWELWRAAPAPRPRFAESPYSPRVYYETGTRAGPDTEVGRVAIATFYSFMKLFNREYYLPTRPHCRLLHRLMEMARKGTTVYRPQTELAFVETRFGYLCNPSAWPWQLGPAQILCLLRYLSNVGDDGDTGGFSAEFLNAFQPGSPTEVARGWAIQVIKDIQTALYNARRSLVIDGPVNNEVGARKAIKRDAKEYDVFRRRQALFYAPTGLVRELVFETDPTVVRARITAKHRELRVIDTAQKAVAVALVELGEYAASLHPYARPTAALTYGELIQAELQQPGDWDNREPDLLYGVYVRVVPVQYTQRSFMPEGLRDAYLSAHRTYLADGVQRRMAASNLTVESMGVFAISKHFMAADLPPEELARVDACLDKCVRALAMRAYSASESMVTKLAYEHARFSGEQRALLGGDVQRALLRLGLRREYAVRTAAGPDPEAMLDIMVMPVLTLPSRIIVTSALDALQLPFRLLAALTLVLGVEPGLPAALLQRIRAYYPRLLLPAPTAAAAQALLGEVVRAVAEDLRRTNAACLLQPGTYVMHQGVTEESLATQYAALRKSGAIKAGSLYDAAARVLWYPEGAIKKADALLLLQSAPAASSPPAPTERQQQYDPGLVEDARLLNALSSDPAPPVRAPRAPKKKKTAPFIDPAAVAKIIAAEEARKATAVPAAPRQPLEIPDAWRSTNIWGSSTYNPVHYYNPITLLRGLAKPPTDAAPPPPPPSQNSEIYGWAAGLGLSRYAPVLAEVAGDLATLRKLAAPETVSELLGRLWKAGLQDAAAQRTLLQNLYPTK